jgi:hypothetical protein
MREALLRTSKGGQMQLAFVLAVALSARVLRRVVEVDGGPRLDWRHDDPSASRFMAVEVKTSYRAGEPVGRWLSCQLCVGQPGDPGLRQLSSAAV